MNSLLYAYFYFRFSYVETIPVGLEYNDTVNEASTSATWMKLINMSTSSIDIVSFYWSLLPEDTGSYRDESCQPVRISVVISYQLFE